MPIALRNHLSRSEGEELSRHEKGTIVHPSDSEQRCVCFRKQGYPPKITKDYHFCWKIQASSLWRKHLSASFGWLEAPSFMGFHNRIHFFREGITCFIGKLPILFNHHFGKDPTKAGVVVILHQSHPSLVPSCFGLVNAATKSFVMTAPTTKPNRRLFAQLPSVLGCAAGLVSGEKKHT